jgi:hypothetical protein
MLFWNQLFWNIYDLGANYWLFDSMVYTMDWERRDNNNSRLRCDTFTTAPTYSWSIAISPFSHSWMLDFN